MVLQTSIDNGAEVENRKDGLISSSTNWRRCYSQQWTQRIVLNAEGEPVWLTPHQRDLQPEGQREKMVLYFFHPAICSYIFQSCTFQSCILASTFEW